MGIDTVALIDHGLSFDEIVTVAERLDALSPAIEADALVACGEFTDEDAPRWTWDPWGDDYATMAEALAAKGFVSLEGPLGFRAMFGRHCVEVAHWPCWWLLLNDPEIAEAVRRINRALARALQGTTAVLLPDSGYDHFSEADFLAWHEGWPLDRLLAWLAENHGPPAETIAAIFREVPTEHGGNTWSGDGYFVDRFAFDGERP